MPIHAIIFDFDGTLINSEPAHQVATHLFNQELGIPTPKESFVGKSLMTYVSYIKTTYPQVTASHEEIADLYDALLLKTLDNTSDLAFVPVVNLAKTLQQSGYKLAIASGTRLNLLQKLAKHYNLLPIFGDHIYSSEQVKAGKPAPDVFLATAQKLGVLPEHTLVIEDSMPGLIAANRANMRVIMVPDHTLTDISTITTADLVYDGPMALNQEEVLAQLKTW
jgi:HAD superfamily hydrolase (TIGR01509 family)